mmetsp:Transcript_55189/g.118479  ORF Transcript_55189/g.118479 Transcript_55189/m.118479 type:complete len:278 (-) Transcript_55189:502-1335(-)
MPTSVLKSLMSVQGLPRRCSKLEKLGSFTTGRRAALHRILLYASPATVGNTTGSPKVTPSVDPEISTCVTRVVAPWDTHTSVTRAGVGSCTSTYASMPPVEKSSPISSVRPEMGGDWAVLKPDPSNSLGVIWLRSRPITKPSVSTASASVGGLPGVTTLKFRRVRPLRKTSQVLMTISLMLQPACAAEPAGALILIWLTASAAAASGHSLVSLSKKHLFLVAWISTPAHLEYCTARPQFWSPPEESPGTDRQASVGAIIPPSSFTVLFRDHTLLVGL